MAADATITIAAASVDTTSAANCPRLFIAGAGPGIQDLQACRISVEAAASGTPASTSVLRFILRDGSQALAFVDATLSAASTVPRTALAGASGNYLLNVAFPNGSDILDLAGADHDGLFWHVTSQTFMTNVTALTVRAFAVQAV